jgi:hypothetical protein
MAASNVGRYPGKCRRVLKLAACVLIAYVLVGMYQNFHPGTVIWAKFGKYPWWPCTVEWSRGNDVMCSFLGTTRFGEVDRANVQWFLEGFEKYYLRCKTPEFEMSVQIAITRFPHSLSGTNRKNKMKPADLENVEELMRHFMLRTEYISYVEKPSTTLTLNPKKLGGMKAPKNDGKPQQADPDE